MLPEAIIFDFDGVLLESEFEGNRRLAELLTELGHPTSVKEALTHFVGLSDRDFIAAVEARISARLPERFHELRAVEDQRVLRSGLPAVAGAVDFVLSVPAALPKAVGSSSSTDWIITHLDHLGLAGCFGDHLYSGREHVARGKPAPDLYCYAAERLGVAIERCAIIEDSVVGAKGTVASGAQVIGLVAGSHCLTGHDARLREVGVPAVARSFDEIRVLLGLA